MPTAPGERRFARIASAASVLLVLCAFAAGAEGIDPAAAADGKVADRYLHWAMEAVEDGRWVEAERALERGADFADSSSDLSYLLALVRYQLGRPLRSALSSVRLSLETGRWLRYSPAVARLLEARLLIGLREFEAAAQALGSLETDATVDYLKLLAAIGLDDGRAFNSLAAGFLAAWPFDARVPRLLLERLSRRVPGDAERALIDMILRRLDPLVAVDPALAYLSAPFIRDPDSRRRLVQAYRAGGAPDPASIPAALDLGLMDDLSAVGELFSAAEKGPVDGELFGRVWGLLRSQSGRDYFAEEAGRFSGTIFRDGEGDGRAEMKVGYVEGRPGRCAYDADQDGLDEFSIEFADGLPAKASIAFERLPRDGSGDSVRLPLELVWSRYPFIASATLGAARFIPASAAFPFAPVRLSPLVPGLPSFRFPEADAMVPRLTERSLVSFSSSIERRGEFRDDSIETMELVAGVPRRATERAGAAIIASTVYEAGRPVSRYLDMDGDGRLETRQRFAALKDEIFPLDPLPRPATSESDWDGDGIYEYAESLDPDGSPERTWRK